MPTPSERRCVLRRAWAPGAALVLALVAGCGGAPSEREVQNARAFEAFLTAVSLRNEREVERDAALLERRHADDEISDRRFAELAPIIARARARDWAEAEKRAYEFRAQFGDRGSYFR